MSGPVHGSPDNTLAELNIRAINELTRQDETWGFQDHAPGDWMLIVSEEFGELAKAILQGDPEEIAKEASEVIACIARLVEKTERMTPSRLISDGWVVR